MEVRWAEANMFFRHSSATVVYDFGTVPKIVLQIFILFFSAQWFAFIYHLPEAWMQWKGHLLDKRAHYAEVGWDRQPWTRDLEWHRSTWGHIRSGVVTGPTTASCRLLDLFSSYFVVVLFLNRWKYSHVLRIELRPSYSVWHNAKLISFKCFRIPLICICTYICIPCSRLK